MPPKCFQTLDNGQRCSEPAIYTSKYCRHHDPETQAREVRTQNESRGKNQDKGKSRDFEPLYLPSLLDKPSMLTAVNQVVQALAGDRIKRSVADTLLSAIKFANRLLNEIEEAGLSIYPTHNGTQQPNHTVANPTGPTRHAPNPGSYITGAVALAAAGNHSKTAGGYPLPDRFLEEMMAQAHGFQSNAPKPDPRFTRP